MDTLQNIRQRYAEAVRSAASLKSDALVAALATVLREAFLGPGPWHILDPNAKANDYEVTATNDPVHLYRDVLVAIDPHRHLNNGQPSYLAFCIEALELHEGDSVVHVGCGVGYYTAIMAEVVGPAGHVLGIEIDADLARRAGENLEYLRNVDVVHGDGGSYDPGPRDAVFVNAGVTHPRAVWLDCLRPGGRLILYLTVAFDDGGTGKGGLLKVRRKERGYSARFLSGVTVFHCIGSRDNEANTRLREAMMRGGWQSVQSLRRDRHDASDACWLHGEDFCLAMLPVP